MCAESLVLILLSFFILSIIFDWVFSYFRYKSYDKIFNEIKELSNKNNFLDDKVDKFVILSSLSHIEFLIERQLNENIDDSPTTDISYLITAKKEIDALIHKFH